MSEFHLVSKREERSVDLVVEPRPGASIEKMFEELVELMVNNRDYKIVRFQFNGKEFYINRKDLKLSFETWYSNFK